MFLVRPLPLDSESLSSWRQRAAVANGFHVYSRPPGSHGSDPDNLTTKNELDWLTDNYLLNASQIEALTLDEWGLLNHGLSGRTLRHWIISQSSASTQRYTGPMACPACLQNDRNPYFRIDWRFAFVTRCSIHKSILIDRCLSCGVHLWPSQYKKIDRKSYKDLSYCIICGSRLLNRSDDINDSYYDLPTIHELQAKLVVSQAEIFMGLWSISQLLLRRRSNSIWQYIPAHFRLTALSANNISLLPVNQRDHVVQAATWLIDDWPRRFVDVCKLARLSREHLSATQNMLPLWLTTIIDNELTHRKRNRIKTSDVIQAIESINLSGNKPTKSDVRRMLKVTESRAIDGIMTERRHATYKELLLVCGTFEAAISSAANARDEKLTFLRDYLIFLITAIAKQPIEWVCDQPYTMIQDVLNIHPCTSIQRIILNRARELSITYAFSIRPVFLSSHHNSHWFTGRDGSKLAGHSIRTRVSKVIRDSKLVGLWNSADAFIYCLYDSAVQGRRQKRKPYNDIQGSLF